MRPSARTLLLTLTALGGCGDGDPLMPGDPGEPPRLESLADLDSRVAERIGGALKELRRDPKNGRQWSRLGMVYEANGLPTLALESYRGATILEPRNGRWLYHAAVVLAELGRTDEALTAMRRSIVFADDYAPSHWRLGTWLLDLGELDEADEAFEQARDVDADFPGGFTGAARVALQRDEATAAVTLVEEAKANHPADRYVRHLLGLAYRQAARPVEAERELALGEPGEPQWADPWHDDVDDFFAGSSVRRARYLVRSGRPAEAIPLLLEILETRPKDTAVLSNLADAYHVAGRPADAIATLRRSLDHEPDSLWTHVHIATIFEATQDLTSAMRHLDRAIALHPTYGRAQEIRARVLYKEARYEEALASYQSALEHDARNQDVRFRVGVLQVELQRWPQAAITLHEVTQGDPQDPAAFVYLAMARVQLGQLDAAEAALRAAQRIGPNDPVRYNAVRKLLQQRRREGKH